VVKKSLSHWLVTAILPALLTSCLDGALYEKNIAIENAEWHKEEPAVFEFDIVDTLSSYNLIVNLRHGANYPYTNIYFFSSILRDSNLIASDTLQYFLADKSGAWIGETGLGDMVENHLMFKPKFRFESSGQYKVRLEQAMRESPISPVYDVGFRVEKVR
jgi:gliding motility-associated lipoprotein GldH